MKEAIKECIKKNEKELAENYLNYIYETDCEYINLVIQDELETQGFPEEVDWDVLECKSYQADLMLYLNLEKWSLSVMEALKEKDATKENIKDFIFSSDMLKIIEDSDSVIIEVFFNLTLNEYLDINPDEYFVKEEFTKKLTKEFIEETIIDFSSVQDKINDMVADEGYSSVSVAKVNLKREVDIEELTFIFFNDDFFDGHESMASFMRSGLNRFLEINLKEIDYEIAIILENGIHLIWKR